MKELKEKDFIHEEKGRNPFPVWFWLMILAGLFVGIIITAGQMLTATAKKVDESPFLQVTNRDYSLFLWSHPEYMRKHYRQKTGYLPDFNPPPRATPVPSKADSYVQAPPELLFEYWQWKRLLSDYVYPRKLTSPELFEFLEEDEQWKPRYWKEAPEGYRELVNQLTNEDISEKLPKPVMQAYVGWKNYFKEGARINQVPTDEKLIETFIEEHPGFERHYWQNIYPDYLQSMGERDPIPTLEVLPFLKAALYNWRYDDNNSD